MQLGSIVLENGTLGYGLEVGGVPIGDANYVAAYLGRKAVETMSTITTIKSKLRDRHLQSLYAVAYHCMVPMFQHWVQHCYPEDVQIAAALVDNAMLDVAATCIGEHIGTDMFALRRLQMPARMYGGGLRSMADVAPAAFLGTLCATLPLFADRQATDGTVSPGFLPGVGLALGTTSFDAGNEETRFAMFLQSGTRMAASMATSWAALQREVGNSSDGPLSRPVSAAGAGVEKLQRELTKQREKARFQNLDTAIRALAPDDMRRAAWTNLDRFSTVWVTAWPNKDGYLSNSEFAEISTFYFGLPSPACCNMIGQRIGSTRAVLDTYGCRLTTTSLPGDGWRIQHDALKWRITEDMREMQARATTEVFGLFAPCIPQAGRARIEGETVRKRQGLIPDFMLYTSWDGPEQPCLMELKTLHFGTSTYAPDTRRCEAVARRARTLPNEYAAKARDTDRKYCGTLPTEDGPVTR